MSKTKPNFVSSSLIDWSKFGVTSKDVKSGTPPKKEEAASEFQMLAPDALAFEKWIPFAARAYHISENPLDYFFRPTPVILSDLPNRNGAGFPLEELLRWCPDHGCHVFQTWRGKPMFEEHGKYHADPENPDPRNAIGVIADVVLTPLRGYGKGAIWKVLMLAALDRTSTQKTHTKGLVTMVERGEVNTYSMGSLVERYTCSHCGAPVGRCTHIDPEEPVAFNNIGGSLAYRLCHGVTGCELSVVMDPAVAPAHSDFNKIAY